MSNYGENLYGSGLYGGGEPPVISGVVPVIVEWYSNTLTYKGAFQTGVGGFLQTSFSISESGPQDFTLYFSKSVGILKKDIIKIKIFNSEAYFFTGVVRTIPIDGSTKEEYNYLGFGMYDYIDRLNAGPLAYVTQTIDYILNDIIDSVIVSKTPIQKNATKIIPPNITIATFDANYASLADVLDSLLKIANSEDDYICGVDQNNEFFFKPRSEDIKAVLAVGKSGLYGIESYEPEDGVEAISTYYVLDKDGNYVTTLTSSEDIDISEEKLTAPDIDNTSIGKWAAGLLAENEIASRSASIRWKIEPVDPIVLMADGYLRVISNIPSDTTASPDSNPFGAGVFGSGIFGGGQYRGKDIDDTLKIVEVSYTISDSEAVRDIQLGALPVRLEDDIIRIRKNLNDLRISLGR
jgi:hypothetical protein